MAEETGDLASSTDRKWQIGPNGRTSGSLHSDIWRGTASELAHRGHIAVYPVSGWWKDEKGRDRSDEGADYALIATITTTETDVDIWTPVATKIGVPVSVVTEI